MVSAAKQYFFSFIRDFKIFALSFTLKTLSFSALKLFLRYLFVHISVFQLILFLFKTKLFLTHSFPCIGLAVVMVLADAVDLLRSLQKSLDRSWHGLEDVIIIIGRAYGAKNC